MLFDIILFDGVDELDVVGPLEVFRRAGALGAGLSCRLATLDRAGEVRGAFGLALRGEVAFLPGEAGVVVVPGGGWVTRAPAGTRAEVDRGQWPRMLAAAWRAGSVLAGVCTGSLLLAHAGIVGSSRAATHHDAVADLAATGAVVSPERVVDEGQLVTSGGVTSGLDLALWLVRRFYGGNMADLVAEGLEYTWSPPREPVSLA